MPDPKPNTGEPAGNPNPAASPAPTGVPGQGPAPTPVTPPAGAPEAKPAVTPEPGGAKPDTPTVPLAALQEERDKRQQLQAELEALRNVSAQPSNVAPPAPSPQQGDFREEVNKLWDTDPRKAVQTEIMMGLTWLDNVNAAMEGQIDSLVAKDPAAQQYRPQVRNYLRTLPLEQRGRPGIAELALAVVKGQNVDSIIEQTKNELYEKFRRGELAGAVNPPAAGSYSQPPAPTGTQLTDEQRNAARAMGLSEEAYASQIQVR